MATDNRVLTAMAHPLRRRLLDVLRLFGPATASTLAERTEQGVGNISHHMRILAEAGLVTEAPELARDRRERWWQRVPGNLRWVTPTGDADPAVEAVGLAAVALNFDRQIEFVRRWLANPRPQEWPEGPFSTDTWLLVTPTELTAFSEELNEVINRWSHRELPDDGADRQPVFAFARAVPAQP